MTTFPWPGALLAGADHHQQGRQAESSHHFLPPRHGLQPRLWTHLRGKNIQIFRYSNIQIIMIFRYPDTHDIYNIRYSWLTDWLTAGFLLTEVGVWPPGETQHHGRLLHLPAVRQWDLPHRHQGPGRGPVWDGGGPGGPGVPRCGPPGEIFTSPPSHHPLRLLTGWPPCHLFPTRNFRFILIFISQFILIKFFLPIFKCFPLN